MNPHEIRVEFNHLHQFRWACSCGEVSVFRGPWRPTPEQLIRSVFRLKQQAETHVLEASLSEESVTITGGQE